MAGWGTDDEEIGGDAGAWGANDTPVDEPVEQAQGEQQVVEDREWQRRRAEAAATDPRRVDGPRRGGTRAEARPFVGGDQRVDPRAAQRPDAGGGRGFVNPLPAAVARADAPFASRQEALADAVDRIELGADPAQVVAAFAKIGITRDEIAAEGRRLGSKTFTDFGDQRPATAPPGQPVGTVTAVEPTTMEGVANFGRRVKERASQAATGALASMGAIPASSAAASMAASQKRMQAAAPGSDIQAGLDAFGQVKTFGQAFQAAIDNPAAFGMVAAESAVLSITAMLAAAAVGMPAMAAAGATSGLLEFGSALTDQLNDKGIDARNPVAIEQALNDPAFMREVRQKGVVRGLTIGTIDAITAGMAGRFIAPVAQAVKAGELTAAQAMRQAATASAKELSLQAAGGGAGEKLAQELTGEDKPFEVFVEMATEGLTFPAEAASNISQSRVGAKQATSLDAALAADIAERDFSQSAIDAYARRAGSASFYDPMAVNPATQREQFAAEAAADTARPAAAAGADDGGLTPDSNASAGGGVTVEPAPPAPTVESQPTRVYTPEELAQIQADEIRRRGANAGAPASDLAARSMQGEEAIGVAGLPNGALAAAAGEVVRANAQETADVGMGSPAGAVAAEGGAGTGGDAAGSVAGRGADGAVAAGAGGVSARDVLGGAAPASVRGRAGDDALTDAQILQSTRESFARRASDQQQAIARAQRRLGELRAKEAEAAAWRKTGVPELVAKADQWRESVAKAEREIEARGRLAEDFSKTLDEPPPAEAQSFAPIQQALRDTFGRRVVAYYNANAREDGFYDRDTNRVFVNLANPSKSVAFTAFHEIAHQVRQEGANGDRQAQLATQMLDQVWGMISDGAKRQYAAAYMVRSGVTVEQALKSLELKDEMLADFMGKRATDRAFMEGLARKNPEQFRGFATKLIAAIDKLLESLKGFARFRRGVDRAAAPMDTGGVRDMDVSGAIRDLERAKLVAEQVLKAWADMGSTRAGVKTDGAGVANSPRRRNPKDDLPDGKTEEDFADARVMETSVDALMADDSKDKDKAPKPDEAFKLDEETIDELQRELADELAGIRRGNARAWEVPGDEQLKAAGIMAESAYNPLPYQGRTSEIEFKGQWAGQSQTYRFVLDTVTMSRDGSQNGSTRAVVPRTAGPGFSLPITFPSESAAKAFNQRVAASIDLYRRDFDLAKAIPKPAAKRVIDTWKTVADLPKAFTFSRAVDPMAYRGKGSMTAVIAGIGENLLQGNGVGVSADQLTPSMYLVTLNGKNGSPVEFKIEHVRGARPRLVLHTEDMDANSGMGKYAYQVAYAFANALGVTTGADPNGLTGINTYRRTEQQFSAALRAGSTKPVGTPGTGQRVYGWKRDAEKAKDHDENMLRLALASARNAAEWVPRVNELRYDLAADTFTWRAGRWKGQDAEMFVKESLNDPNLRKVGLSRSTLARAAVTFEAMDGKLDLDDVDEVKSPILYSTRDTEAIPVGEVTELDEPPSDPEGAIAWIAARKGVTDDVVRDTFGYRDWQDYVDLAQWMAAEGGPVTASGTAEQSLTEQLSAGEWTPEPVTPKPPATSLSLREIMALQTPAPPPAPPSSMTIPTDEELRSAGIMAEDAYTLNLDQNNAARVPGRMFTSGMGFGSVGGSSTSASVNLPGIDSPLGGEALSMYGVSESTGRDFLRRIFASGNLFERGFDLFTAVPSPARARVLKAWQTVGNMAGAFRFKRVDPLAVRGMPPGEMLYSVARQVMAGSGYSPTRVTGDDGWMSLHLVDESTGRDGRASVEVAGSGDKRRLVMHTAGLPKGSGMGAAFYQAAFAFAHEIGIPVFADPVGLTAVNTYRRTEQMMSAAARQNMRAFDVNPGAGQRIYGWNLRTTDDKQRERNFVRLALAAARNAAEFVPVVTEMSFDPRIDSFTWKRGPMAGKSANEFVSQALADPDARAVSISRSTLARAAITFGAIDGDLRLDEGAPIKSPLLYSVREPNAEYAPVDDPLAGDYNRLEGRQITFDVATPGSNAPANVTIDAARYLRSLDRRLEILRQIRSCVS